MTEGGQKVKKNGNNGGIPFMVLLEVGSFKVTMVGVSTGDAGTIEQIEFEEDYGGSDKKSWSKQMRQMTSVISNSSSEFKINDRDPLFVANVGDYYS
ncbi:hypothetical protein OIU76_000408 [Salix suchowensis]|nr:hypothetical protein OIU76_000408 [Salix suchowensis]